MRLLAGENFPKSIIDALRSGGHDVMWARTDCSELNDFELLELAESTARVLITLDKDFWQIAVQRRAPLEQSGAVLFPIHPATPDRLEPLVRTLVAADKSWTGHIRIVTADGIQMLSVRGSRVS